MGELNYMSRERHDELSADSFRNGYNRGYIDCYEKALKFLTEKMKADDSTLLEFRLSTDYWRYM